MGSISKVEQSTGEGVNQKWHWNSDVSRRKIKSREWDYIVLQDRSSGPLEEPDSFQKHAGLLDAEVKKSGPKRYSI